MIRIRASSIAEFADCPARWRSRHLDGLRLPPSGSAHLGTALHRSTGAFDGARLAGSPVTADDTAGLLVDALQHPEEDVNWADRSPREAERVGLILHSRYCHEVAPARQYVGVEIECESLTVDADGVRLELTGTTDRVRRLPDGGLGVSDLKSSKRAVGADGRAVTRGHGLQLALYELLVERELGQPVRAPGEIVGFQTTGQPTVGTAEMPSHRAVLIGTPERPGLLDALAMALKSGVFIGNARSSLCSPKFCPGYRNCPWRD